MDVQVLVAYATKYGATVEIAEKTVAGYARVRPKNSV